jgi:hypothetical protein
MLNAQRQADRMKKKTLKTGKRAPELKRGKPVLVVIPHVCRESKTCTCYQLALEPDESCPQHGAGEWPPRCAICGHFMKWETHNVDAV